MAFLQIRGVILKWEQINHGLIPLLNYVKNSNAFAKFAIKLVAL